MDGLLSLTDIFTTTDDANSSKENVANMDETDWMSMLMEMRLLSA